VSPAWTQYLLPCFVAPLALLALQTYARPRTRLEAFALGVATLGGLATLAGAAPWLAFTLWLPVAYGLVWLALAARSVWAARAAPWVESAPAARMRAAAAIAVALAFAAVFAWSLGGRFAGGRETVALAPPVRDGTWVVAQGGTSLLLNAHVEALDSRRLAAWKGQAYACDLVRVDARGLRARHWLPTRLDDFHTWNAPVYAPCAGRVLATRNDALDRMPPSVDPGGRAGNFVLLECGAVWVALAHLKQGSIAVERGAVVAVGTRLGLVGSSGTLDMPRLHVHAQRAGDPRSAFDATPLPIAFGGRVLGRNEFLSH
jgi:hypothetical protein